MFISTCKCSFKCEHEDKTGRVKCQNSKIALQPTIPYSVNKLIRRYQDNCLTQALVIGGLEPLDQLNEILSVIKCNPNDDVVIYTGYTFKEVLHQFKVNSLPLLEYLVKTYSERCQHIILKVGRYMISECYHDDLLGIDLASNNQWAFKVSDYLSLASIDR